MVGEPSQDRFEVRREREFEAQTALVARVREAKFLGVEEDPRRLEALTHEIADVDAFAEERMSRLSEVNANLVRSPGFESALDLRGSFEMAKRAHVRRRFAAQGGVRRRASQSVSSVLH